MERNKKPRICLLGKLPPPYMGPAIATQVLLQSGLRERFELLHVDTKVNEDLRNMGKWSISKLIRAFCIYLQLFRICLVKRPALVLVPISQSTTGFSKDALQIIIARLTGRRVLLHLRGSEFKTWMERSSPITRSAVRWIFSLTRGVIVLGNNLRYLFKGYFPDEQIFVAPNGADYTIPVVSKEGRTGLHVLYLGNLQPSKGIEDLIAALPLLPAAVLKKCTVDVIGGWRNEATRLQCEELIRRHDLPVVFHPPSVSNRKLEFLAAADIFVFPPRAPEGHPWVIVEAMAAGLPIISTDQGAIVESVQDGENGYIIPPASPALLADRLNTLLTDSVKRQRMGRLSRKKYESGFTEQAMVDQLSAIFTQVIS